MSAFAAPRARTRGLSTSNSATGVAPGYGAQASSREWRRRQAPRQPVGTGRVPCTRFSTTPMRWPSSTIPRSRGGLASTKTVCGRSSIVTVTRVATRPHTSPFVPARRSSSAGEDQNTAMRGEMSCCSARHIMRFGRPHLLATPLAPQTDRAATAARRSTRRTSPLAAHTERVETRH